MAQFQYTAVNAAGKKLSGLIGAGNEEEARKQLNTFGISLLAIEQTGDTPIATVTQEPGTSSDLPKFEFEAYDKQGRKVLGTIPASNAYKGFKRLMDEYQFEVAYVVPVGASEEDRLKAKQEGIATLKLEYEAHLAQKNSAEVEDEKLSADFEIKRQELLKKVDFILAKIKELLAQFDQDLKPEARKLIEGYLDKLLRIKSSTNLDYIEATSEELLKKVQDQELFLTKEKMAQNRAKLRLEAQKMMAGLHSKPAELTVTEKISEIHEAWSQSHNPILQQLDEWVKQWLPSPEEKLLKQKIKTISGQIWTYRKILWTSPASTKEEVRKSLSSLSEERTRLKVELKALQNSRRKKTENTESSEPLITEELNGFLGWLLGFYLAAYFASIYGITLGTVQLLNSELLRNLLLTVFVWHVVLSLRLEHLRYQKGASLLTLLVGVIVNAAVVYNL